MSDRNEPNRTPRIAGAACAFPGERHSQEEVFAGLKRVWENCDYDEGWAEHFFDVMGVENRHLALPKEAYLDLDDFGDTNDAYIECATEIGARAVENACVEAGVDVRELDALFFTTVTGIASPSIDAKVINALELNRHIDRVPMFGLGCVGGAAGTARVADYLRGHPDRTAALLAVELCSLTLERSDPGIADLIAAALFADGAGCVVCRGADARGEADGEGERLEPAITDSGSVFYHDMEWVMGWDVGGEGFHLVLSGDLPDVVESRLADDLGSFLGEHGYGISDIERWICHPGGPKVIGAIESALGLESDMVRRSRASLREIGNLSSVSVLHVLKNELAEAESWSGPAVMLAMGPGFSAEFVLLEGADSAGRTSARR